MEDKFAHKVANWDNPMQMSATDQFASALRKIHNLKPTDKVMEFGCGTGLVGLSLAPLVEKMVMLDSSEAMISKLIEKLEATPQQNVTPHLGKLENYDGVPLNAIISFMTLHHIEEIDPFFSIVYEKLTSNGVLIIGDLIEEDGSFHSKEPVPHNGFSPTDLAQRLEKKGFKCTHEHIYGTMNKNGKEYPLFIIAARKI